MSVVAYVSQTNIILKITATGSFLLERKIGDGSWLQWDGSTWVASPGGILVSISNFTDYGLSEGIYQYRYLIDGETEYVTSNCVAIGGNPYGWTFGNYEVPDGQWGELLTPDDVKYSFMWGVQFTASDGTPWTDEQTRTAVIWAIRELERALSITIISKQIYADDTVNADVEEVPDEILKEFPYSARRKRNWLIRLKHRPVQSVSRVDWYSPVDQKIMSLSEWMRLDKQKGLLWFYPRTGANVGYVGYAYPWNYILMGNSYVDAFHVDYLAGWKSAAFVPKDIQSIVGIVATMKLLNVIGDGLIAGFSSSSLSMDGMSESFSSTQSATSAFFGARIMQYSKTLETFIKENKHKYNNYFIGSL